eukprot:scaffold1486_cov314-Pavlova_lutheri.AAC.7
MFNECHARGKCASSPVSLDHSVVFKSSCHSSSKVPSPESPPLRNTLSPSGVATAAPPQRAQGALWPLAACNVTHWRFRPPLGRSSVSFFNEFERFLDCRAFFRLGGEGVSRSQRRSTSGGREAGWFSFASASAGVAGGTFSLKSSGCSSYCSRFVPPSSASKDEILISHSSRSPFIRIRSAPSRSSTCAPRVNSTRTPAKCTVLASSFPLVSSSSSLRLSAARKKENMARSTCVLPALFRKSIRNPPRFPGLVHQGRLHRSANGPGRE